MAMLEEAAKQAKLAQQQNGISSEQRAKINELVDQVRNGKNVIILE